MTTRPGGRGYAPVVAVIGAVVVVAIIVIGLTRGGGEPEPSASQSLGPSESETATSSASPSGSAGPTPLAPIMSSDVEFSLRPADEPPAFENTISCTGSIGPSDSVAIVRTEDGADFVLRDYADPANPVTVCTFGQQLIEQLVDARHIVIGGDANTGVHAVVDLPEVEFHWFALLPYSEESFSNFLGVSPGLDQIVWMSSAYEDMTETPRELHLSTEAGDSVIAQLPDSLTGFCGSPPDYSREVAYSRSGDLFFSLDHPMGGDGPGLAYGLRVFDGTSAIYEVVPPAGGWPIGTHPANAIWSTRSDTLYYRQGRDVWQWDRATGATKLLPTTAWSSPSMTREGTLAYGVDEEIYLADLAAGTSPTRVVEAGVNPVFVNESQLWFQPTAMSGCAGPEPPPPQVYDIVDGVALPTIIRQVHQVWPTTSALP